MGIGSSEKEIWSVADDGVAAASACLPNTIFKSDNLAVRYDDRFGKDTIVVTFSHWTETPNLEAAGWQQEFLARHKLNAIHFVCASNAWFLYPEMAAAISAAAAICSGYSEVVTWGSSMGGYQAIKAAAGLAARRAIAVVPQYSVDPGKVPFDKRWTHEASRIPSFEDDILVSAKDCTYYLIFDRLDPVDAKHAKLIRQHVGRTEFITLPFSGHDTGYVLAETGLFTELSERLVEGRFDAREFRRAVRNGRRNSPTYLAHLARCSLVPKKQRRALLARARELGGHRASVQRRLGDALASLGDWEEAAAAVLRASELAPHEATHHHMAAFYLSMAGDFAAVAHEESEALRIRPDWFDALQGLTYALHRLGDVPGALAAAERALSIRYDPQIGALRMRLLAQSG